METQGISPVPVPKSHMSPRMTPYLGDTDKPDLYSITATVLFIPDLLG